MKSRIQLLLGIAVVAALLVMGVVIWVDRMEPISVTISPASADQAMHVSVTGAVASPGVVEVPVGARLQDVVDGAGGFTAAADLTVLNLAGRVGDGEQIVIPEVGTTVPEVGNVAAAPQGNLIDLNTATAQELDALPGIGEVLGGRIVEYREQHGPFTSIDQLAEVDGISPRLVGELRPYLTISTPE